MLIDSTPESWNMDPALLAEALGIRRVRRLHPGRHLRAVRRLHGDRAPAVPSTGCHSSPTPPRRWARHTRESRQATSGRWLPSPSTGTRSSPPVGEGRWSPTDAEWADKARWLSTQARDPAPHYQHSSIGYNYRLSNLLAALGRSQLIRSEASSGHSTGRTTCSIGRPSADLLGVEFMPEAPGNRSTFWLTTFTIDPARRRDRPGVGAAPSRVARHRGQAGVEADASPTRVRRLRGLRRSGIAAALRARSVHTQRLIPDRVRKGTGS